MANFVIDKYKLDITPQGNYPVVYLSQYEDGRDISFYMLNRGVPLDIPSEGISVFVSGLKSNGGYFEHTCDIVDSNTVIVHVDSDMTDVSGRGVATLTFTDLDDKKVISAKFVVNVQEGVSDGGIEIPTEAETIFQQLLDEIRQEAAKLDLDMDEIDANIEIFKQDVSIDISTFKEDVTSDVDSFKSDINDTVDAIDARMDNFIATQTGTSNGTKRTETILYNSNILSYGNVEDYRGNFDLLDDISNYDYVEVRYSAFGKTAVKILKSSDISDGVHWSESEHDGQIIIDSSTGNRSTLRTADFHLIKVANNTVGLSAYVWGWNGASNANGKVAENFTQNWDVTNNIYVPAVYSVGIYSIVGIKYEDAGTDKDAELTDIRVGADGTVYQTAGAAVRGQIQAVGDELNNGFAAFESDGVVPSAEQMLSENVSVDSVPYHFRKTASDNADREELEIVGGSVAWNQKMGTDQLLQSAYNKFGITFTPVSGRFAYTASGTFSFTSGDRNAYLLRFNGDRSVIEGHKYLVLNTSKYFCAYYYATSPNTFTGNRLNVNNQGGSVITPNYTGSYSFALHAGTNIADDTVINETIDVNMFDLTAMFGSTIADYIYNLEQTTAGAGVALFKSLFPNDYYEYNAGELISVSGLSEHKTVGFNQWDEEWELGSISQVNGGDVANTDRIRSKNYIPVFGGMRYFINQSYGVCASYDGDKNYIGSTPYASTGKSSEYYLDPQENTRYIRFSMTTTYGATYNHDISINLSDPAKNGIYEPYKAHSYLLDSTLTLRGVPRLDANNNLYYDGDVYASDGKVKRRYGIVDLGTLTWYFFEASSTFPNGYFRTDALSGKAYGRQNIICTKYPTGQGESLEQVDKQCLGSVNTTRVYVVDSAYTDVTTFTAAMSGVYMVYELATPTTEQADPYVSPQICSSYGTEEFVSTGIVPVGHNTKYPDNLRMKLDNLPWNFANLIAPTESTYKATRNYTTGALLIVNNVLYKATANIANGGNITVGTNVTATTLAEVIAAL